MSSFSRWFRSHSGPAQRKGSSHWERRLEALEVEAENAPPGFQGTPLNRAGDLCLKEGDRVRALRYYGRAIDTLLEDGQLDAARGVANKIIRIHPEAIRTLCTLTWLDLAARHMATAVVHLQEYVKAARRGHQEERAVAEIVAMARTATQREFIEAAARALEDLGADDRMGEVLEWAAAGRGPDATEDRDDLASRCLHAAVGSNERRRAEGSLA